MVGGGATVSIVGEFIKERKRKERKIYIGAIGFTM
jgi:hypothetical protein